MYSLNFKYNGHEYSLSLGEHNLKDQATGEVCAVSQLRDLGLIAEVKKCLEAAESQRVYRIIAGRMFDNLRQLKRE